LDNLDCDLANLSIEDDEFELDEDFLLLNGEAELKKGFKTMDNSFDDVFNGFFVFHFSLI